MDFDSDGVRLHYELNGPAGGVPIVLVHGFASDYKLNWVGTRWQETLTGAGFRVIGLDCRGHGHSEKPHQASAYSVAIMAGDVRRLLDHLEVESAAYVGYSMGARIGLQLVLDSPDRILRAVWGGIGDGGAIRHAGAVADALEGAPTKDPVALRFFHFASEGRSNDLHALAACFRGLREAPNPERMAAIRVPILIVIGDRDDIAGSAHDLIELIPSARLVTLAGRDHMSAVPAREFKRAAEDFLTAG